MRILVVGANGFVGSAFVRYFRDRGDEVLQVTRDNYQQHIGVESDVTVDAAGNSRKFWAEQAPWEEFDASVAHRMRTLRHFPAALHLHISSVDVYDDLTSPASTRESETAVGRGSHYGFHKLLAEQIVMHHAPRWLILRLAGMVGPGLRKNPIFDILQGQPLRIHPESRYQFMHTARVVEEAAHLIEAAVEGEVFNLCGDGTISPREIAARAGRELDLSELPPNATPRIVDINIEKISARGPMPRTVETVAAFVDQSKANS